MKKTILLHCVAALLLSCSSQNTLIDSEENSAIKSLTFIDEIVIPNTTVFKETKVGGLSGIDYANGTWYVLSDDRAAPRFYNVDISFTSTGFEDPIIRSIRYLEDTNNTPFKNGQADPESLRITGASEIMWNSEGNIKQEIAPFVRIASMDGSYVSDITVANRFLLQKNGTLGPRNNGVFEGLCKNYNSDDFWVITELPLKQDGLAATSRDKGGPVRLSFIDSNTSTFGKEYAYQLEKVARSGLREVNGVTEILSYDQDKFLVLERSFASGYEDGGNNVKLFLVDITDATDVSTLKSLNSTSYIPVKKTLLLDFETIRSNLTDGIVDNIEGMTFGPNFVNGKRSLVLISDNNFNAFGSQITQLILFEVN